MREVLGFLYLVHIELFFLCRVCKMFIYYENFLYFLSKKYITLCYYFKFMYKVIFKISNDTQLQSECSISLSITDCFYYIFV